MTEVCPRCMHSTRQNLEVQACMYCGFVYYEFTRYDPYEYIRENKKQEQMMYNIGRRSKTRRMKPATRRIFIRVMKTLKDNPKLAFEKRELANIAGERSVVPVSRILRTLQELGVADHRGKWWFWEITKYVRKPEVEKQMKVTKLRQQIREANEEQDHPKADYLTEKLLKLLDSRTTVEKVFDSELDVKEVIEGGGKRIYFAGRFWLLTKDEWDSSGAEIQKMIVNRMEKLKIEAAKKK